MYSLQQRIKYNLTRHITGILLVLVSLLAFSILGNIILLQDSANIVLLGTLRVGLYTTTMLIVTKFVFNKLNIQERIKDNAIALAIFAGLLWLSYSNVF